MMKRMGYHFVQTIDNIAESKCLTIEDDLTCHEVNWMRNIVGIVSKFMYYLYMNQTKVFLHSFEL